MSTTSLQVPNLLSQSSSGASTPRRGIVVFSGGSAANSLVDVFDELAEHRQCSLNYIIPISDNGGSSSELIRVFGGPGIGDIRSRLVRLIPPTHTHLRSLLNHRLPSNSSTALNDWNSLVSGTHSLWPPIPSPARELLRSILNHLNMEILKRARPPHSTFNFSSASVGNLFLTGARLFTGSFESAIYLLTLICGVPESTGVIPAINSNFSHHISAGLENGDIITGQNAISHPSAPTALPDRSLMSPTIPRDGMHADDLAQYQYQHPYQTTSSSTFLSDDPHPEDANLPGSLPTLRQPAIHFSKAEEAPLPARIRRIWYINPYGQEILPAANPKAVSAVRGAEAAIYSIGSLYTSILPCLVLRGIGEALAMAKGVRFKILILNGTLDRETGLGLVGREMGAVDFVGAIARAGEESQGRMGLPSREVWKRYVTHVVYMDGEEVPEVNRKTLAEIGVECVRCWGRKGHFDPVGLQGALEAVLGKREWRGDKSRRNTLET
ncbi:MAG: hypothetical protein MMC23_002690 [Stictis urceolatum]|nr:hypothetical protein [Stictis urceolata]